MSSQFAKMAIEDALEQLRNYKDLLFVIPHSDSVIEDIDTAIDNLKELRDEQS